MRLTLTVIKPMNRCSDSITGSPSFTMSTRKLEDGRYEAKCDSLPDIPAVVDQEEAAAIRGIRMAVERHIVSGGRF